MITNLCTDCCKTLPTRGKNTVTSVLFALLLFLSRGRFSEDRVAAAIRASLGCFGLCGLDKNRLRPAGSTRIHPYSRLLHGRSEFLLLFTCQVCTNACFRSTNSGSYMRISLLFIVMTYSLGENRILYIRSGHHKCHRYRTKDTKLGVVSRVLVERVTGWSYFRCLLSM